MIGINNYNSANLVVKELILFACPKAVEIPRDIEKVSGSNTYFSS